MILNQSRYIFTKSSVEQTSRALDILSREKSCPRHELNRNSAHLSPVKMAYISHEPMTENNSSEKAGASPVIIMHGIFGSKSNWNSLSRTISEKTCRKVVSVDVRNHGDSPHASESSYLHIAEDVALLVKDLGSEKAVMIGHSLGGRAMMYLALSNPEVVEKLVVIDISPLSSSPRVQPIATFFDAMQNLTLDENLSLSEAREMADQQLSTVIKTAAIRENLLQNLVEAEPGKYKWRINLPVLKKHFDLFCSFPHVVDRTFIGPTVFIGGSRSDHLPVNDHEGIKQLFPTAKIEYIPDAGHWPHVQKPQELVDVIAPFINDTNGNKAHQSVDLLL